MWQISRPPCEWGEFGQVFNGQLEHLGDWKTAESLPMFKGSLAPGGGQRVKKKK